MTAISAQQAEKVLDRADRLYTVEEVEAALERMASRISHDLAGTDPILVCIMTGGVVPFGKLLPKLQFPLQVDYVHTRRYGDKLSGGPLQWIASPSQDPSGRTVLLVDDILDEGATLAGIEAHYAAAGAREIRKAVLVVKNRKHTHDVKVDFIGLEVPNRYVFGYGMDYKGYWRNAPGVYAERGSP